MLRTTARPPPLRRTPPRFYTRAQVMALWPDLGYARSLADGRGSYGDLVVRVIEQGRLVRRPVICGAGLAAAQRFLAERGLETTFVAHPIVMGLRFAA